MATKWTKVTNEKANLECRCPKCGSERVQYHETDYIESGVQQSASCDECGCYWVDNYYYANTIIEED